MNNRHESFYALLLLSGVFSVWQFAQQAISLPTEGAKQSNSASRSSVQKPGLDGT
jgi:hypothetical protein